jgi:hypothetical protein
VDPNNGTTTPATLNPAQVTWDYNNSSGTLRQNGWMSWNVIVPSYGPYKVSVTTGAGGTVWWRWTIR